MNGVGASYYVWAIAVAIGLPVALVVLTELEHGLRRRGSRVGQALSHTVSLSGGADRPRRDF